MTSSSFPISSRTIFVADASVVINLNATGRALDIIRAQPEASGFDRLWCRPAGSAW